MRTSLRAQIGIGLATEAVVFGLALGYLAWTADRLLEEVSLLKGTVSPTVEDLTALLSETRGVEDLLGSSRSVDLDRSRLLLQRLHLFDRLRAAADALEAAATSGVFSEARSADFAGAAASARQASTLQRRSPGQDPTIPPSAEEALTTLIDRLDAAQKAGAVGEAETQARAILRVLRLMRGATLRVQSQSLAALREAEADLVARRTKVSLLVIGVSALALVVALVVLLYSLRALRPVGDLIAAIRRLAAGDHAPVTIRGAPRELAGLSEALNGLAQALSLQAERQARAAEDRIRTERLATVGRMASVVAHEIRNPLNSISLNVDLLAEMVASPGTDLSRMKDLLRSVQGEVDRLSEITEEYLRFGRMPRGVLAPCDLGPLVRGTLAFLAEELGAAGVQVQVREPDHPVRVSCDEGQLRQALQNLVRNAREAMPEGGLLEVAIEEAGDEAIVRVRDHGVGIPEAFRSRIFEPFATTKPRGTGLGLAFVQQVMQESNGRVEIETREGAGTTVSLIWRRQET
ncbi:MAG TPA: ATP-binding protein [Myxococcota bacterium]|nr:ATP-binding protein [Myxococcota bacterium]HQK49836.1 ATP-binding protein [Myxococcota bacterium]